jgi:hypothetical protein
VGETALVSFSISESVSDFVAADIKNNAWIPIGTATGSIRYGLSDVAGNDGYALAIDGSKNVYIGGLFSNPLDRIGIKNISNVTVWNTSNSVFLPFGDINQSGTDGSCNALLLDASNQRLYVGGAFKIVKDSSNISISSNNVSIWNALTKRWTPIGLDASNANGLNAQCRTFALDTSNEILYVGGDFTKVTDISRIDFSANYVARWNIQRQKWSQLGGTLITNNGLDASCTSLLYDDANLKLYAGGNFKKARDTRGVDISTNYIAGWNVVKNQWEGFSFS